MSTWDRILQKQNQMTFDEQMDYIKQGQHLVSDENLVRAVIDDENIHTARFMLGLEDSNNGRDMIKLKDMINTGNKQAMYDIAAIFFGCSMILHNTGDKVRSDEAIIRAFLWVEEAQKTQ